MNPEAIQRVAQNLPTHMMQTLSAVANQTPNYPHTPGGAYGASNYINTVKHLNLEIRFNVFFLFCSRIHQVVRLLL